MLRWWERNRADCATRSHNYMKTISVLLFIAYSAMAAGPAPNAKPPAQAARGQAVFFDENEAISWLMDDG